MYSLGLLMIPEGEGGYGGGRSGVTYYGGGGGTPDPYRPPPPLPPPIVLEPLRVEVSKAGIGGGLLVGLAILGMFAARALG